MNKIIKGHENQEEIKRLRNKMKGSYFLLALGICTSLMFFLLLFILLSFEEVGSIIPYILISFVIVPAVSFSYSTYNYTKNINEYQKRVRIEYVEPLLEKVFNDLDFKPMSGVSRAYVDRCGIRMFATYGQNSENYISATYRNQKFVFADLKLTERRRNLFEGQVYQINIFTNNKAYHKIKVKSSLNLDTIYLGWNKETPMVKHSISEFEYLFDIYSSDIYELKELLSEDIKRAILKLNNYYSENIEFIIFDNKIHLLINSKVKSFFFEANGLSDYYRMKDITEKQLEDSVVQIRNIQRTLRCFTNE